MRTITVSLCSHRWGLDCREKKNHSGCQLSKIPFSNGFLSYRHTHSLVHTHTLYSEKYNQCDPGFEWKPWHPLCRGVRQLNAKKVVTDRAVKKCGINGPVFFYSPDRLSIPCRSTRPRSKIQKRRQMQRAGGGERNQPGRGQGRWSFKTPQ